MSGVARRIHKWFAVTAGAFILAWFVSGLVMLLSPLFIGAGQNIRREGIPPLRFKEVRVSVPQAIAALEDKIRGEVTVNSVQIREVKDILAYEISLGNGSSYLVDAQSGELFTVSRELAEEIARDHFSGDGKIASTILLTGRDYHYLGRLPVYKIRFDDDQSTWIYVSAATGRVEGRSNRSSRLLRLVTEIHFFEPIRMITGNSKVQKGLLLIFTVGGIGVVGTGFYLALSRKKL